jgi:hypothetical protein
MDTSTLYEAITDYHAKISAFKKAESDRDYTTKQVKLGNTFAINTMLRVDSDKFDNDLKSLKQSEKTLIMVKNVLGDNFEPTLQKVEDILIQKEIENVKTRIQSIKKL